MDRTICFFIGHRDAPDSLRPALAEAVERHITQLDVAEFVVGHYGRFDAMAAAAVRAAKKRHPAVTLVLLLPYYPFHGNAGDYDDTFYPPGMEAVPKPFAIVRANAYMVSHCDHLICYDCGLIGNTRELVALARKRVEKGLMRITNLASTETITAPEAQKP